MTPPAEALAARSAVEESNHRFANHLASVAASIAMQVGRLNRGPPQLSRADVQRMLESLAGRVEAIGRLHRLLASAPANGYVAIDDLLQRVGDEMIASLGGTNAASIDYTTRAGGHVDGRVASGVVLLVHEVIMNSLKHAHPSGVPVRIAIDSIRGHDGRCIVTVSDDGVGLPVGFDWQRNGATGFRVIRGLAAQIGAQLEVLSEPLGLVFRFAFHGTPDA